MIIANYEHRLPTLFDVGLIRRRAAERGALWDDVHSLYFKAFLLRENGQYGAIANSYSSLYLWQSDAAFHDFLVEGCYKVVTDSFGRAPILTNTVLEARRGPETLAAFVYIEQCDIPLDNDLTKAFTDEQERCRDVSNQRGVVVAVVSVDTLNWRFKRILVCSEARGDAGVGYEVLYLAQPMLQSLHRAP